MDGGSQMPEVGRRESVISKRREEAYDWLDKYADYTYFMYIKASLSELHRETRRVVRPVIHGGQEVLLTDFGRPVARIIPYLPTATVSAEEARGIGDLDDEAILSAIEEGREERTDQLAE